MKLLPGGRVGAEDLGGVRLAEALDEGAEDDRDGDEHHGHDHLEDPPVHVQLSILVVGREKNEHRECGEGGGRTERHAGAEPPAPAVLLHAALHAGEQVGRGLDVVGARVQRVAQAVFEPAHRWPSNRCSSEARPRCRWVFTEFGDSSRVSAISGMPRSSR